MIDKARKYTYNELARLAEQYTLVREGKASGPNRTKEMGNLVKQIRNVARRTALQALETKTYLQSTDAGRRIVGLAILEELTDNSYFDQVLDKVTNSKSAFEQYNAVIVMERMLPRLSSDQRKRLQAALEDQMSGRTGKWIEQGTNRWAISSRILTNIK